MNNKKVTVLGGGVLGTQIGLMCAYYGYDTTFWLRSEGSIGRTQPKIERYTNMMLEDLRQASALVGSPMGRFLYPKGLIKDWDNATAESLAELYAKGEANLKNRRQRQKYINSSVIFSILKRSSSQTPPPFSPACLRNKQAVRRSIFHSISQI